MLLLDDRFAPITSEIGFLQLDLRRAVDAFVRWQEPIQRQRGVTLTTSLLHGPLESLLRSLVPLTSVEARRHLFIPTTSDWTAFYDCGYRGTDATGPMSHLATAIGCQSLRVVAVPHHKPKLENGQWRGRYGATILDLFGATKKHYSNSVRSIAAINDGGKWRFEQRGDPLPFEDLQPYSAARVRDRFGHDQLAALLAHLGLDAFHESFYRHQGILVEKHGPNAIGLKEYTLEEVRSVLGRAPCT